MILSSQVYADASPSSLRTFAFKINNDIDTDIDKVRRKSSLMFLFRVVLRRDVGLGLRYADADADKAML